MRFNAVGAALLALASGKAADAQASYSIGVGRVAASHSLLSQPLTGVRLGVRWPTGTEWVAITGSASRTQGASRRLGSTCGGFILLTESCAPQPLRDESDLTQLSLGMDMRIMRISKAELAITLDGALAVVSTNSRADTGTASIGGGSALHGLSLGALLSWRPLTRSPLRAEIGWSIGALSAWSAQMFDAYEPFAEGFALRQLHVAVSWRR